jgi:hypothetical protein
MNPRIKITKEQQAEIVKIKEVIAAHQLEQDKLVDNFIKSMNLPHEGQEEIIWDYLYNDSSWMVELE